MSGSNSGSNTSKMAVPQAKEAMNRFKQESVYICMLSVCDERSLEVVKATAKALIDTAPEK